MNRSERRPLGRSGLTLPVLGLGCAQAGGLYRAIGDDDARALLDGAWDCGLRWFDTAPYYGYTRSEHRVGRALAARPRDAFVLSTKVGRLLRPDASVAPGVDGWADPLPFRPVFDYSHDGVLRSFEDSLQRLGLARIDLLLVHDIGERTHGSAHALHWDALTRGGGFRALDDLRRCGAVAAIGLGVNEWQVARAALDACDLDCTMLAGRYTLLEQASLSPFLDVCTRRGHAVIVAAPFNSGVLAGGSTFDYAQAPPGVLERVRALHRACRDFDVPLAAAALQFPLAHPAVAGCVVGAHSADEIRQNVAAFEHVIPPAFWAALRDRALVDVNAPLPLQGVPC
ncbi:MAG TPA: aldo/keto reductase [Albitalea sp.]|uniref:aldo/keto reductase n=1 Tax=Piscinibacter sp. TaxID=1903157 RepID=UPI002ED5EAA4